MLYLSGCAKWLDCVHMIGFYSNLTSYHLIDIFKCILKLSCHCNNIMCGFWELMKLCCGRYLTMLLMTKVIFLFVSLLGLFLSKGKIYKSTYIILEKLTCHQQNLDAMCFNVWKNNSKTSLSGNSCNYEDMKYLLW